MLVKMRNPDMESFVKYPKLVESYLGLWPSYNTKWTYLYKLYSNFITLMMSLITASGTIYLLFFIEDLADAFEALYLIFALCIAYFKYMQAVVRIKQCEQVLRDLENPLFETKNEEQREKLLVWLDMAQKQGKILTYSTICSVAGTSIFPIVDRENGKIPLSMKGWFPYDVYQSTPVFVATFVWQNLTIWIAALLTISVDMHICALMNIGSAQIEMLRNNLNQCIEHATTLTDNHSGYDRDLNNIEQSKNDADLEKKLVDILSNCIKHHNAIKKLFIDINNLFNPGLLIQMCGNSVILCMCGMEMVMLPVTSVQFISTLIFFCVSVVQLILLCFNGQFVITESNSIIQSIYTMEWYKCSTGIQKILFIIMENSKNPINVLAGGVIGLSLPSFILALRTSYSYFTVFYGLSSQQESNNN